MKYSKMHIKCNLLVCALFFMMSTHFNSLSAQSHQLYFGPSLHANFVTIFDHAQKYFDHSLYIENSGIGNFTPGIGFRVDNLISNKYLFSAQGSLHQSYTKGAVIHFYRDPIFLDFFDYRLLVSANYMPVKSIFIGGGAGMSYIHTVREYFNTLNIKPISYFDRENTQVNSFDIRRKSFFYTLNIGYLLNNKFVFEAKYSKGFGQIEKKDYYYGKSHFKLDRTITLSFSYLFQWPIGERRSRVNCPGL